MEKLEDSRVNGASENPKWFNWALGCDRESRYIESIDGCTLHLVSFCGIDSERPNVLFLHGLRASSNAWDFIAPYFSDAYNCYALDFRGMGNSQYSKNYSWKGFCQDILAAIEAIAGDTPLTLVCHSFGGDRGLEFLEMYPEKVSHLVIVDSFISFPDDDLPGFIPKQGRPIPYPDFDSIIARYVLDPPQPSEPWLLEYMAKNAVKKVEDGWAWKFDVSMAIDLVGVPMNSEILRRNQGRCDFICGEKSSLVRPEKRAQIKNCLGSDGRMVVIPDSYHHCMLDQPIALVTALRALL